MVAGTFSTRVQFLQEAFNKTHLLDNKVKKIIKSTLKTLKMMKPYTIILKIANQSFCKVNGSFTLEQ
jgi:mRNA-degrading endonuclease RelE of RelBE toxin-antitoxin system